TAQDVLEELRFPGTVCNVEPQAVDVDTGSQNPQQRDLLQQMGYDPVSLDALQARTGLATAQLQAQLLELELDGQVARLPGGLFQRMGRS
ncbi:MAG: DNA-protecting protein DprA, partial [Rhodoferax sp.]